MPASERINFLFQKYVTKGVALTEAHFEMKLTHAVDHIRNFRGLNEKSTVVELGTGWYPIVPLALYLNSGCQVISFDIQNWLNCDRFLESLKQFLHWERSGRLEEMGLEYSAERLEQLEELFNLGDKMNLQMAFETIGFKPLLGDAGKTDLADDSIDYICSNNTFEHIYPKFLIPILREFKRIIKPEGIMSHFIDLTDHFAHFDQTINAYNFLQYSEKKWGLIDNTIQPQNRLRWKDYLQIYSEVGISYREIAVRSGYPSLLKEMQMDVKYAGYSDAELAITHGYLVSNC